jgi:hypothetical protein
MQVPDSVPASWLSACATLQSPFRPFACAVPCSSTSADLCAPIPDVADTVATSPLLSNISVDLSDMDDFSSDKFAELELLLSEGANADADADGSMLAATGGSTYTDLALANAAAARAAALASVAGKRPARQAAVRAALNVAAAISSEGGKGVLYDNSEEEESEDGREGGGDGHRFCRRHGAANAGASGSRLPAAAYSARGGGAKRTASSTVSAPRTSDKVAKKASHSSHSSSRHSEHDSDPGGEADPYRNARLAKENRERKKAYIAGLEARITQLMYEKSLVEAEKQQALRVADNLLVENHTLRITLSHQTALAPIFEAMQNVPGLSFGGRNSYTSTCIDDSSDSEDQLAAQSRQGRYGNGSKRARVHPSATTTLVPLTFMVQLTLPPTARN